MGSVDYKYVEGEDISGFKNWVEWSYLNGSDYTRKILKQVNAPLNKDSFEMYHFLASVFNAGKNFGEDISICPGPHG